MLDDGNVSEPENLETQIQDIFDSEDVPDENPETNVDTQEEPSKEEKPEDSKVECPEEFLKSDGSIDVNGLLKSYQEIASLADEKAEWEKERESLQKQADYAKQFEAQQQTLSNDFQKQLTVETANIQADEYEKFLHTVAEPDRMRGLLALYRKIPTPELLARIEEEYSLDVIKRASILSEQHQNARMYEQYEKEAKEFVSNAINNYPEWFNIPEFVGFFKEALAVKGDAFETSKLIQHLENLKQVFYKQFLEEQKANSENEKEKNLLKNLSPKSNPKISSDKRLEDYTDAELESAIEALV